MGAEGISDRVRRGLEMMRLARCDCFRHHNNVEIVGPAGTGKANLACTLGQKAGRAGFKILYCGTSVRWVVSVNK